MATQTLELHTLHLSQPASTTNSTHALHKPSTSPDDQTLDQIIRTHSLDHHSTTSRTLPTQITNLRAALIVFQLCLINFLASFTNGVITVGLPTIATSISLPRSLYLWPTSVYGLTSGATLLLAGAIADLIGPRVVDLIGCVVLSAFSLACGFAGTGIQLVLFRALQGVGMSMHLPSSVAIVAAAIPHGKARNVSFGCLGLSQPLGFSAGLVVSGILIEKSGWRMGFYLSGGMLAASTIAAMWSLPKTVSVVVQPRDSMVKRLWREIDWVGGVIASAGLALLSYVLAILSADLSVIRSTQTPILLTLSVVLLLAFPAWMHQRQRSGKPALIPNALWKKSTFTSTCIMVALSWGTLNAIELFSSLYFQEIQDKSALGTSLQLLPNLLMGVLINLTVGLFVDRISARWLVAASSLLCAVSPLMMAVVNPSWSYWYMQFWAQILAPTSGDVLFTVGLLIISSSFPSETQALAGAVFSTVAQFGMSLGVTVCQVVALGLSDSPAHHDGESETGVEGIATAELLKGYRASFWTMFAFMVVCAVVAVGGMRKAGKVGLKKD